MKQRDVFQKIDDYFGIRAAGSSFGTEIRGGVATFLAMSYIVFVNPAILSTAIQLPHGNSFQQLLTATALSSAIASILMGVFAKYPFALAPGMGLNAYFTYTVVIGMKIPWQTALAAVFVSSVLFLILTVSGIRQAVIEGIPDGLKRATVCGIGFFLAFIGLVNAGIVVSNPATLVTLGPLTSPSSVLAVIGILVTGALMIRRVPGAIILGIFGVSAAAILLGIPVFQGKPFASFTSGIIAAPIWPVDLFFAFDFRGLAEMGVISVIFTFFFVDFFDNAGTFIGLAQKVGLFERSAKKLRTKEVFMTDAIASGIGSALGTSTVTSYIESAAGIEEGAKTGLAAVVVGILFFLTIFLWPLASAIPAVATAPVLILIGAMMMESGAGIKWNQYEQAIPAFLTICGMTLTYSISNGISFGIVSFVALNALTGKLKNVKPVMWVLSAAVIAKFIFMG